MTISNIFKMEMYRNFRDRAYLIVIAVLTGLFAIAAAIGISLIFQSQNGGSYNTPNLSLVFIEIPFVFALFIALAAFSVIYPWHLLSTDYNNKVLSLVVASGVKRSNYYFVKLLATIVSSLLAYLAIGLIPVVLLLGFFHVQFFDAMQQIVRGLTSGQGWMFIFSSLISSVATMVILYFVVVLTRGKFWGVFVFLGIRLGLGVIISTINLSISSVSGSTTGTLMGSSVSGIIFSLIEIVTFGIIGFVTLKRQDL